MQVMLITYFCSVDQWYTRHTEYNQLLELTYVYE